MFENDINRTINGVVKVDQNNQDVIRQEVDEYIITKELKKHFVSFFDAYSESFNTPTSDTGVWISGFFGSGKSHFLKMLSYILENKEIDDISVVERFRQKFSDDPATFMLIDNSTRHETETILFNIDVEGSVNIDETAVLRVFANMFYSHLGFSGRDLKVTMLEKYIEQEGKTEEFRRVFEEKKGKPWVEVRDAIAFNKPSVIPTLMEVLGISEDDAVQWFNDKSSVEFSISDLVNDIKDYVNKKPAGFRLVFLADEVGQYIGTDTNKLLNLQSLTEELGSKCNGKVWIICTGQEALDDIIKVREDEFSRIQARFKTRLSLSSSSVDEVIQKRILKKTEEADQDLQQIYEVNDASLRNLFTFKDARLDIKGYGESQEFANDFPFVPYQFIMLQKVFTEIRKHGNSGKHLSGGERSMLSGFQEAAQKIQTKDEHALVPFYRFYDTVHSFLDSSIRNVIERCANAAEIGAGIEDIDVDVLKLLYLIRYVDDIPANLDNIVILMADDIRMDKIEMRNMIRESLDRLLDQNYINRNGEIYTFLTDEEQDVAREIKNTLVDTSTVVTEIGKTIFQDIYTSKKYRYKNIYDFSFDKMVDGIFYETTGNGIALHVLTVATDATEKSEFRLMTKSKDQVIVVLPDSSYYESYENSIKIDKYIKQRNLLQLQKSMQEIIHAKQDEKKKYESSAKEALIEAIENAEFYADGEHLTLKGGNAKSKIDRALEYLVTHVYNKLDLIDKNIQNDSDLLVILNGNENMIAGTEPNRDAKAEMEDYLDVQDKMNLTTSMADVQKRFKATPYGWREIDIAAVAAQLIADQEVVIKYGGNTIHSDDVSLPDMLHKNIESGRAIITKRTSVSSEDIKIVRDFLREYFDVMDVKNDEDGLVSFIIEKFTEQLNHYEGLDSKYEGHNYPDRELLHNEIVIIYDILGHQKDNIALIDDLINLSDRLMENKEKLQHLESFFKNQFRIFDAAVELERNMSVEIDYLAKIPAATEALNQIQEICKVDSNNNFDYSRLPELHSLMETVNVEHERLLSSKREDLLEAARQCMETIKAKDNGEIEVKGIINEAERFYAQKKDQITKYTNLALLDSLIPQMTNMKDTALKRIESANLSKEPVGADTSTISTKKYRPLNRAIVFPAKKLESQEDIDEYVAEIKYTLEEYLIDNDGIELK